MMLHAILSQALGLLKICVAPCNGDGYCLQARELGGGGQGLHLLHINAILPEQQ